MATAQEKLDLIDARILEVLSSANFGQIEVTVDGTTIKGDKVAVLANLEKIRSVYALRVNRANNPGRLAVPVVMTYRGRYDG